MPVRRKKALTKAQIAALDAYEPHLSAASRQACLEATAPQQEGIDPWDYPYRKGTSNAGNKIKGGSAYEGELVEALELAEEYVVKQPTYTFAIWCPERNRYISDCTILAKITIPEDGGFYLEEPVTLTARQMGIIEEYISPHQGARAMKAYIHLKQDGRVRLFKPLGLITPDIAILIEEGPLCGFLPV